MLKVPVDAHRTAAGMRNIVQRTQEKKWVAWSRPDWPRPDEQQKPGFVIALVHVSLARRRVFARGALGLPVEASRAYRKVLVSCRGQIGRAHV